MAGSPSHTRLRNAACGATTRVDGWTKPLAAVPPNVTWQQSLSQDLLETAGPGVACAFLRQQHFPWLRPQELLDPLKLLADSCTSEAEESNIARHAAIAARTTPLICILPSIRLNSSISLAPQSPVPRACFVTLERRNLYHFAPRQSRSPKRPPTPPLSPPDPAPPT